MQGAVEIQPPNIVRDIGGRVGECRLGDNVEAVPEIGGRLFILPALRLRASARKRPGPFRAAARLSENRGSEIVAVDEVHDHLAEQILLGGLALGDQENYAAWSSDRRAT